MIWTAILRLTGGHKLAAQAVVALAVVLALWGGIWALRSDAADGALAGAYKRFNELRIEYLLRDKELKDEIDNLPDDCLADAALDGVRRADCPSP